MKDEFRSTDPLIIAIILILAGIIVAKFIMKKIVFMGGGALNYCKMYQK